MNPHLSCEKTEAAFVGCVVQSGGAVLHASPATTEHFSHFGARTAFTAALWLNDNAKPINSFTVRQRLTAEQVKAIGGELALAELCRFPTVSMAEHLFSVLNEKLALRRVQEIVSWANGELQQGADPSLLCAEFSAKAACISPEAESENVLSTCLDVIDARLDRIDRGEVERGYRTPIDVWDNAFGGILPGQMYALAGRPGCGKTAMMEMFINSLLSQGAPVCVFEKDMSPEKLLARIACRGIGLPFWRYARGTLDRITTSRLREATKTLRRVPLYVYNPANLTADKMCAIARRDIRLHGVAAVFLDHIQALRVGNKQDLRAGLTQASLTIRSHVTETNVPHILLAHINRDGAKGRPSPENIKEFDQLYGDCDGMGILWSEKSRADLEEGDMLEMNFYVAKNRDGEVTDDPLIFDGAQLTFKNKPRE